MLMIIYNHLKQEKGAVIANNSFGIGIIAGSELVRCSHATTGILTSMLSAF
jgi:hypothetical protein